LVYSRITRWLWRLTFLVPMRVLVIFEHFFLEGSVYHKVVCIHQTALALIYDDIEQLKVFTWLKYPIFA
jgi:hypothetical protein